MCRALKFNWYGTPVRWLVFTNLYVALCGAALTGASYVLLGLPARLDTAAGMVFCGTLVIYNLDRLAERETGGSTHERWVERNRKLLWAITWLGAMAGVFCATQLTTASQWSLVPAGLVAVGYCLPIIKQDRYRYRRLKELPGAKLPLIALVWTYATMGLPMLESGVAMSLDSAVLLMTRFLFLAAVAMPFDVPDMQRDQQSGIATLPTLFGVRTTRWTALTLTTLAIVLALLNPWPAAIGVLVSLAFTFGLVFMLKPSRSVVYFMVLLDGMLLIQAASLWALG